MCQVMLHQGFHGLISSQLHSHNVMFCPKNNLNFLLKMITLTITNNQSSIATHRQQYGYCYEVGPCLIVNSALDTTLVQGPPYSVLSLNDEIRRPLLLFIICFVA